MTWKFLKLSRKWLIFPPIFAGIAVVVWLGLHKEELQRKPEQEHRRVLRVIQVPVVDVVPRILAYGTAKSGQIWRAVAEVRGRVVEKHPEFKPGAMIKRGETLLRIDPAEYELAIARLEADIGQTTAQLEELAAQESNDRESLKIEEDSLVLAEQEQQRFETLIEKKAVSASAVDDQKRKVLAQRQSVQRLTNTLRLVPQQRKALEAVLAVKQSQLRQAKLDLGKTILQAPFDCRLGDFEIELGQFFAVGERLFEAHSTALSEVEAQVPLSQLRTLVNPGHAFSGFGNMDMNALREFFDFDAVVRLHRNDIHAEWKARVARIREQVDAQTHTIGLVVAVDKPYEKAIPRKRPPLFQGMYCEVEFRGEPLVSRVVIPRSAIHDGEVYLVDSDNRLQRRTVEVAFLQSNFACLRDGLKGGETLIVSDPTPAIEGLWVEPEQNDALHEKLIAEATAEGDLK